MNKFILILAFAILTNLKTNAQVYINPGVDTTDATIKGAVEFYTNYMNNFKGRTLPDFTKYWSADDCLKYKVPDPGVYGIGGDYPTYAMAASKTITYVKPLKNGTIIIKTVGANVDSLKNIDVYYITTHFIIKNATKNFQFISPINHYKENWKRYKLRNVNFGYQKSHTFNKLKADSLISQIKNLEKQWNLKPIEMEYFFADTYDEIQLIRGYDFSLGLGNADKPSGIANQTDNIIYCAGSGENYFHEVVHIYLNRLHPESPLNEGLAVFYGGSMGKPLQWHANRLRTYLENHKNIDLNKLQDFWQMDNYTNPQSTIQGILCQEVFKRNGFIGLQKLMTYKSLNEIFEKEFKFDLKNLNKELRTLINNQN